MPLNEHVYRVAIAFKMTERVQQQTCIKFCIKLHYTTETIQMTQKATATSDWQLHHDNLSAHASGLVESYLAKHRITQVLSPPTAQFDFWLFSKLKSSMKGKRFQTIDEIQENTMGQLMAIGRTGRSQGAYFEGD